MSEKKYILLLASIAGLSLFSLSACAYTLGRWRGEEETVRRVNAVLHAQAQLPHLGGTWDAIATEFNGEP